MVNSIFSIPLFKEFILPFLLVFTLIFAILDRSKMLGEEKRQINAIISLVIALIFLAFDFARNIVVNLMPYLVVFIVILFVFMLIFGFITAKKEGDVLNKGLKIALGTIFGVAVLVAVLFISGGWDWIYSSLQGGGYMDTVILNLFILAIIGGAIAVVLASGKKEGK
ncbi:hypothetical protein A3K73_09020 [Candidatus Pacearchaeota archaeon RBG_13_36_9]|nr:MAG: hypothetical protein A3K73_09020 [Candidatus Pacearchaeota archaeon RBG_13_36_9]